MPLCPHCRKAYTPAPAALDDRRCPHCGHRGDVPPLPKPGPTCLRCGGPRRPSQADEPYPGAAWHCDNCRREESTARGLVSGQLALFAPTPNAAPRHRGGR